MNIIAFSNSMNREDYQPANLFISLFTKQSTDSKHYKATMTALTRQQNTKMHIQ